MFLMRRSRRIHLVWFAVLAGLLLMQTGPSHADTKQFNPAQPFKPFDLPALEGGRHTLEEFRGHPLILSVWASWCAPCRYELPAFQIARKALAESHPDAVLMTINLGDGGARAKGFMDKLGLDLPVLLVRDGEGCLSVKGASSLRLLFVT